MLCVLLACSGDVTISLCRVNDSDGIFTVHDRDDSIVFSIVAVF